MTKKQKKFLEAYKLCYPRIQPALDAVPVSRTTHFHWKREYPEFAQALKDIEESKLDMVENSVFTKAIEGDMQAAKMILQAKARDRGYGESVEVHGKEGGPIEISVVRTVVHRKEV